jgi:hypothetical protein
MVYGKIELTTTYRERRAAILRQKPFTVYTEQLINCALGVRNSRGVIEL